MTRQSQHFSMFLSWIVPRMTFNLTKNHKYTSIKKLITYTKLEVWEETLFGKVKTCRKYLRFPNKELDCHNNNNK